MAGEKMKPPGIRVAFSVALDRNRRSDTSAVKRDDSERCQSWPPGLLAYRQACRSGPKLARWSV